MKLYRIPRAEDRTAPPGRTLTFGDTQEATLEDLKAALAEFGMVAVPVEPTDAMQEEGVTEWSHLDGCCGVTDIYKAMIKAAEENTQ